VLRRLAMPISTKATEMLGIEHPIVMGGLTGVGVVELAAAVSNAGGLGMFTAHNAGSPEGARQEIRRLKSLTSKPFGVNLTVLPTIGTPPPYEEYARVFIEEGVKVVETAGSNPKKWVEMFKAADPGIVCIHKCVAIRHALKAEQIGVDIISLDGFECAGHPGEDDVGNFVLQAKGAKMLTKPYICSGGVANGRQLAAALALGAAGVNCGTRFAVTKEGNWPQAFKERAVAAEETATVLMFRPPAPPHTRRKHCARRTRAVTATPCVGTRPPRLARPPAHCCRRKLHNTARAFRNKVTEEVEQIEAEKGSKLEFSDIMPLVMGKRGREAEARGDPDGGVWSAGQSVGLIDDIPTCMELVPRIVREAEEIIRGLCSVVVSPQLAVSPQARL